MPTITHVHLLSLCMVLSIVIAACGYTAYEIPGEPENPRKFQANVEDCRNRIATGNKGLSFNECMAEKGYVARTFVPGERKTLWLPSDPDNINPRLATTQCGAEPTLEQITSLTRVDAAVFFECMKSKGFTPKTVDGNAFPPVVFVNNKKSAIQQKQDYGLCGAEFSNESVRPFDIYTSPNNPIVSCLLRKGYVGFPIQNDTRILWREAGGGNIATDSDLLSCGAQRDYGEIFVPLHRLTSLGVCMEKRGFEYIVAQDSSSVGYRIVSI